MRRIPAILLLCGTLLAAPAHSAPVRKAEPSAASRTAAEAAEERDAERRIDTAITVDRVQVTAIKQGRILRSEPVAATTLGTGTLSRERIGSLSDAARRVPNLHIPAYGSRMTSSVYVRGLGARIDQPVVGLNVDNVPILNKNNFDMELADVERIEVLRGPQSTLYGRNTMGGVINVYTLSPLAYEGVRLLAEWGSGASGRLRASLYRRIGDDLGISVAGYYTRTGGFYENLATGRKCDRERMGGGRIRLQWRGKGGWSLDNTLSFSLLDQGGYPYVYIGEELRDEAGDTLIRPGEIRYDDPCSYRRTTLSEGLTLRYDTERVCVASITGYHYSDDAMTLDQDFLPLDYFTLRQAIREHAVTEDLVVRSRGERPYRWLFGAFGFYRHATTEAPVNFKQTGIERLIFDNANAAGEVIYTPAGEELPLLSDFRNPSWGAALYHESSYSTGRWRFTAGLRVDFEHTRLTYRSRADMSYFVGLPGQEPVPARITIDDRNTLAHSFTEVLPRLTALYAFDGGRNLYLTLSKGYKAGGFNTQIFSDILQEKLKWQMASGSHYEEPDIMSYRPEHSWNLELGGHFVCAEGMVRGDAALFWIECRDQQLTLLPEGTATGRMMTNAGRSRSLGGELSLRILPHRNVEVDLDYGYTDARFRSYRSGGEDFSGRRIPYAPAHTLSAGVSWSIPTGVRWLGEVVLHGGMHGTGRIWWNEQNTRSQGLRPLFDASAGIEHPRYSLTLWGRNLADERPDVFYFKTIGNEFVQRGRPRAFGITLSLNID